MSDNPEFIGDFARDGYAVIQRALTPQTVRIVEQYSQFLERYHREAMIDETTLKARGRYVDPLGESILADLTPLVERAAGVTLFPTYSFLRVYRAGAELKKHTDRPSCEISSTLYLGGESDDPWPIHVEINGEARAVPLEPGDLMVYRGVDVPHWRDVFQGARSAHLFLHFVNADGAYGDLAFDQREGLGAPPRVAAPVRLPSTPTPTTPTPTNPPATPAPSSPRPSLSSGQSPKTLTVESLVADPSFCLTALDLEKGVAIFRQIDESVPPAGCALADNYPGSAIALDNLLQQKVDELLPTSAPMNFIWTTNYSHSSLFAKGLNTANGLFLYHENMAFSQLAQLKRAIDFGQSKIPVTAWRRLMKVMLVFLSRAFKSGDLAMSKELPVSTYIMEDFLNADPRYRGVFVHNSLEEFLAQSLKQEARINLARGRVAQSYIDLPSRPEFVGVDPKQLSDAEVVALHWIYVMSSLAPVLRGKDDQGGDSRVRTLNNRAFISAPGVALEKGAAFFGRPGDRAAFEAIATGPVFAEHAKTPGQPFTLADYESGLAAARAAHGPAIQEGLRFAEPILARMTVPDLDAFSLL